MTADNLTVAGRRFRTRADYEAALRDQKKIEGIRSHTNFNSPRQVYELFNELQNGIYRFETAVGTDFDDEIYELVEKLKAAGITADQAEDIKPVKGKKKKQKVKSNQPPSGKKQAREKAEDDRARKRASKTMRLEDFDKDMQKQILDELKKQEQIGRAHV